jgi:hypothetical protein
MRAVPDCARKLPEVGMQEPVGALHIKGVECHVGGGGEGCTTNEGHLVKVVHVRGAVGIGGQVSSLREGELGEEVSYRRKGSCGRWSTRKRDGKSVGDHWVRLWRGRELNCGSLRSGPSSRFCFAT